MKTRSCRLLHYIAGIKTGSVIKLPNVNSGGHPALRFKNLKDIFESENAKHISSNPAVEHNNVKAEPSYLPEVGRTLWEEDLQSSENGNDDYLLDDLNMTLRQLTQIYRGKKRKVSSAYNSAKQVYDNMRFREDEFDLKEPLIHWKQKLSENTPKRKRKSNVGRTIRSDLPLSVKSEPILDSEDIGFSNTELSLVFVKTEDPETESCKVPNTISFIDFLEPNFETEIPNEVLEGHVCKNQELVLYGDGYQDYFPDPSEDIEIEGCDSYQKGLCVEECQNCVEPISLPEVTAGDNVYLGDEMMSFQPSVVSSTPESDTNDKFDYVFSGSSSFVTPCKDQICHVSRSSNDSHVLNETSGLSSSSPGIQGPDTAVNTEVEIIDSYPPATQTESLSSQPLVPSLGSHASPTLEDESVSANKGTPERDQDFSATNTTKDCQNPTNHITSNSPTSDKESPHMANMDSNSVSSTRTATFLDDHTLSGPVFQNPGRLTRKIIPPTSQERLCLSMNCEELHNDSYDYKCKEKLFLREKRNSNPSIISNIVAARRAENTAQPGQLTHRKVVINLSPNLQKEKTKKQGFSPKGNLEQPSYSRSLACLDTGCTSVNTCSKGAIAFSQRQMHGIDSLAGKLINELKSMKDIVEQKLLLNSCRNLTLRNDADEVVAAIKSATRVEENAKRFLSVMTRDCNRFCKIMRLTRDGPSTRENEVPRGRRKTVFADEVGEMLFHVKYIKNGWTSMCPLAQKPDNQIVNG